MASGVAAAEPSPKAPSVTELPRMSKVEQAGVTWTFAEPVPVGRFVNGDFYVVGPVTIAAIDPAPADGHNGSVKNLSAKPANRSGFDSRTPGNRYEDKLRAELPVKLAPGDNLVSSISATDEHRKSRTERKLMVFLNHTFEGHGSRVFSYSILTCLAEPVPADTFRPGYCDRQQRTYRARDLQWWRLQSLKSVEGTPSIEAAAEVFRQPWIDIMMYNFDSAVAYQPMYARESVRMEGVATLLLNLDYPKEKKKPLLVNFVQYGIDLWSIVRDGEHRGWEANGGHGNGRKWPIVFAGMMLGDKAMASPSKTMPDVKFGQDMQTMYGPCWTGAKVVYAGHRGVWKGKPVSKNPAQTPYEHLQPKDWSYNTFKYAWRKEPTTQYEGEVYRRSVNSPAWVGVGLAGRIMHAEPFYAHDAFFDYVDRWMTEEDDPLREKIMQQVDAENTKHDFREEKWRAGRSHDPFVQKMWAAYRGGARENAKMAKLIDPDATPETVALWEALHRSSRKAVLFGHQNANYEGLGWRGDHGRSDVRTITGDWPAVFGFGFQAEPERMVDLRKRMLAAHAAGAMIEMSWHPNNPVTAGRYNDVRSDSLRAVLPGGKAHHTLVQWLDSLAELVLSLKDKQGRPLPLVFRPWHEHNGGWFWWGSRSGSAQEYIRLWRFTVQYLRDKKNVHQLIYAISPNTPLGSQDNYLRRRFPDMEWVDVIGFDHYVGDRKKMDQLLANMRIVEGLARKHGKLAAATEVGWRNGLSKYGGTDFWAGHVLPLLEDDDSPQLAWLLTWRNGHKDHYWVPTDEMGKAAADDFRAFCKHPRIWLAEDWKRFHARPTGE